VLCIAQPRYGGPVEIDIQEDKHPMQLIQEHYGTDIGMLTEVTVYDNKLYLLGSLQTNFIGVYQLKQ
jgi:hypothetical protein